MSLNEKFFLGRNRLYVRDAPAFRQGVDVAHSDIAGGGTFAGHRLDALKFKRAPNFFVLGYPRAANYFYAHGFGRQHRL